MSLADLQPGLKHTHSVQVDERLTVPAVSQAFTGFSDMPPVFATAFLVGFVEWTCIEALRPYLDPGQKTVGVHVDLSHSAATPVGMRVTAEVELVAVEGRRLRFKAVCRDDAEVISEGHHERYIIDADRFLARLNKKRGATA
ncbi:thioesterase family protein [Methylobacterium dankookense]|uniref:Fluoroacetyl-CoA thioesterase n=1 Tax=Methylobacterium dankookense TaxID=560405 RepID=A0A564G4B2_9HYPH|nr:thioesterase family protein [Methylobacterium dankookense]GJD59367.1 Fluoroacetyl-CoA thioesterase [Methylobacterium dankookense]VUF14932.1 Fluoroacetyl-CoA thioesterase [Methylobacterium dankookense]